MTAAAPGGTEGRAIVGVGVVAQQALECSTAVLTSATLTIGGSDAMAGAWGLTGEDSPRGDVAGRAARWRGIDVGSPFQHAEAGILYVAAHLPPPGATAPDHRAARRDHRVDRCRGWPHAWLVLVDAGRQGRGRGDARTVGYPGAVSGRRHHVGAGAPVRRGCRDVTVRHAVAVAGRRRSRSVAVAGAHRSHPVPPARRPVAVRTAAGGHGARRQRIHGDRRQPCRAVAGAGRRSLLRRVDDRGVVAVLDSRMATARYGGYLRASLPPFWATTDAVRVRAALERLRGSA